MVESKVKPENYINIQGWMLTDLHLKGNELLIYAIIYGFSQAEGQVFNGGLRYLADWTNSTKQSVIKVLKSLEEKNLIVKRENVISNVKICEYYATKFNGVVNKVEQGGKQSLMGSSQQSLPNNIQEDNNLMNNKGNNIFVPPTFEEVQAYADLRGYSLLAKKFYDYFTIGNWIDSKGNKVKNWKQKFISWEERNFDCKNKTTATTTPPEFDFLNDTIV